MDPTEQRTGLKLILPALKGGKLSKKAQKNVEKPKIQRPVKLKPLKEVLIRLINLIKKCVYSRFFYIFYGVLIA